MEPEPNARDLFEAVQRNRNWLAAPFLAVLTAGTAGAFLWPDTYVSSAVFRVMPPAISGRVVPEVFNVAMADRVASLQQSILSRTTLTGLIETYHLFPGERARLPLEDVVEAMRRDITVSPLTPAGGGDRRYLVFRVAFAYPNRFDAQRVTSHLVSRFLDDSKAESGHVLDSVNQFLRDEFDHANGELQAVEARLEAVRRNGGGGTLEGSGLQLHQLSLAEARGAAANAGLARARQEMVLVESELRAARARLRRASIAAPAPAPASAPPVRHPLELALEKLLARYQPAHPDVVRLQSEIEAHRARVVEPAQQPAAQLPLAADADTEERVLRGEGQARAKALEIARLEAEVAEAASTVSKLNTSIAPGRTTEYEQLVREHELALQRHREARRKLLEGEAASKGNRWNLGETLELVDAPTLPENPVAPHRAVISAASAVAGLLVGFALVWLRESGDEAIRSIRQLRQVTASTILGGIPLLENDLVVRRRR